MATLCGLAACGSTSSPLSARFASGDEAIVVTGADPAQPGPSVALVDLLDGHADRPLATGVAQASAVAARTNAAGAVGRHWLVAVGAGDDDLVTVDPATGSVGARVPVGLQPDAVATTDDGHLALVADGGSGRLTVVDLTADRVVVTLPLGAGPHGVPTAVAVSPSGSLALVADEGADAVTPVDLRPLSIGTPVAVGAEPDAVAFAPSGAVALIADLGDDQVTVLDGSTAAVTTTLSVPVPPTDVAVTRHPAPGATVATDPAGTAWVSGGGDLVPIDLATMTVGQPIAVGRPAEAVALTDGGRTAWVASTVGTLTKVDLVTGRVEGTTHVGGHPTAVVVPVSAPPPAGTAR